MVEVEEIKPNGARISFDSQFQNLKRIDGAFGPTEIFQVIPERTEGKKLPLVFASGMSATPVVDKGIIRGFFDLGREVISLKYDQKKGKATQVEHGNNYMEATLIRSQALIAALEEVGVEKVDMVGHSQGALIALTAAALRPDLFNTIVLSEPPGMLESDSVLKLIKRQLLEENPYVNKRALNEPHVAKRTRGDDEFTRYILRSVGGTLKELRAAVLTNTPALIEFLQDKGVKMAIVNAGHDFIFPTSEASRTISSKLSREVDIEGNPFTEYDISFISVAGSHNEIQYQPEKWTEALDSVIIALDKKKGNRTRVGYPNKSALTG